ncbi:MAG: DsbE family thiol:disulfide interchange protein [Rhodospirillales bacterium]|nr:DsbE family thiol:disulfide interchange protein [Rhodospirillales bacterium]
MTSTGVGSNGGGSRAFVRRLPYLLPLALFGVLAAYFWAGLGMDPHAVPSVLIDQKVEPFDLAPIGGRERGFSSADLQGQVSLVNVFGSWCIACQIEHPYLTQLAQQGSVPIFGIDWREKDAKAGPAWLGQHGDPYALVGDDPQSRAAIAFGVTGAPESFIVDAKGIIRYKHVGPITPQVWEETLWPIVRRLQQGG